MEVGHAHVWYFRVILADPFLILPHILCVVVAHPCSSGSSVRGLQPHVPDTTERASVPCLTAKGEASPSAVVRRYQAPQSLWIWGSPVTLREVKEMGNVTVGGSSPNICWAGRRSGWLTQTQRRTDGGEDLMALIEPSFDPYWFSGFDWGSSPAYFMASSRSDVADKL
ncbi:hypothetical protein ACLB2K_041252 [Fragaria x ananassa]